jgi:hypothetical protein
MTLFEPRANLLPATLARMEKPLCSIYILEQQLVCLFAEVAVARFHWNRHKEFYLATMSPRSTNRTGRVGVVEPELAGLAELDEKQKQVPIRLRSGQAFDSHRSAGERWELRMTPGMGHPPVLAVQWITRLPVRGV